MGPIIEDMSVGMMSGSSTFRLRVHAVFSKEDSGVYLRNQIARIGDVQESVRKNRPNVLLLDTAGGSLDLAFEVALQVKGMTHVILLLSEEPIVGSVEKAKAYGVAGWLLNERIESDLVNLIRKVCAEETKA
jgi:AmiR/NasT family two-component response regulator